jgi:hypothetical protein
MNRGARNLASYRCRKPVVNAGPSPVVVPLEIPAYLKEKIMSSRLALKCVLVFGIGFLSIVSNASAQTSAIIKVSDVVEGTFLPSGVSAARCGNNIVVGFGDSEAPFSGGAGVSASKDGGKTFSELAPLPTFGGSSDNPSIGCWNSSLFYYVHLGFTDTDPSGDCSFDGCTDIAISTSTNGGFTWNAPLAASSGSFDNHQFSQPAFAIDPTNANQLYVAYVDNNTAPHELVDCDQTILEFVTSSDGGKTWNGRSRPAGIGNPSLYVDQSCYFAGADPTASGRLSSPSIVVSPDGSAVYLTYAFTGFNENTLAPTVNEIRFRRSLDHGATFGAIERVSTQAIANATPKLAVDRTHSPHRGQIFLTWSGQPNGTYTSVLESDSLNGGASFSFPRPVNGTPATGAGRFQANPVIATDNDGQVQVCYYNTTTNTPTSSSVYSYNCATSSNHAATWQLQRVANSAPVGYDAVTSDFLTHHDGFFTAFELQSSTGQRHVAGQFSDIN